MASKEFGCGDADVLGVDSDGLICCCGDERASGQMVGFAKEAA